MRAPRVRGVSRWPARAVLVLAATLLSLGAAELVLRIDDRFAPPPYRPEPIRPDLYEPFEPHGYRLWPSRTVTYRYPRDAPRTLTLTSNRDGFRSGRELDQPDDRPRLLILGDSFVFGQGVEAEERFTNQLESRGPGWRVDNLGMTGYGADLMVMALEHVVERARPDAVLLCMYTDDFRRVFPYYSGVGYEIPRFRLRSGRLERRPFPHPAVWDSWRLVVGLRRLLRDDEDVMFAFDLNEAILDRYLDLARTFDFLPGLVFLPGRSDTPVDAERRAWLGQFAWRRYVPYLDLTDDLLFDGGPETTFIPNNWHLNPVGHRIVAERLQGFLAGRVLENNERWRAH